MRTGPHVPIFQRSLLTALLPLAICGQVNVLTYQYDNTRAGANLQETLLTPANVNATQFGRIFTRPVDGEIYGQPLYFAGAVYVATEHDSVYAFDGNSGAPLWQVNFLNAAGGVTSVPSSDTKCGQITPEIGITSTPVVDPVGETLFVVAMTKETVGGTASYVHRIHALDTSTGAEKPGSPVVVQATFPGTGEHGTTLTFNPHDYKQRPGLLLLNGVLYTAWSSHCDIGAYHGWLIAYDSQTLKQLAVYNNTPNGNEGSFWAGGAAPAVDSTGNLYVVSGNGTFDPNGKGPDLGESFIKISSPGLSPVDSFTPYNFADLNNRDLDTGSAGVALIGDEAGSGAHPHLMAGAGKEGRIYLLDRDNLGKQQAGSDSQIVQSIPGAIGGLFGNPAYFNQTLFFCGSGDNLKAFSISNAAMSTAPTSRSSSKFGFPGCVPTISASGKGNGVVWVLDPAGLLRAYDASNLGRELYNSSQNAARDSLGKAVKFSVPTVANGKVYAGTQTALAAYGLLPSGSSTSNIANAASGDPLAVAPGSIASIYGSGLAASTAIAASFPIPATLGGASLTINGISAPLLYASSTLINFQVPWEVSGSAITVTVSVNGSPVSKAVIPLQPAAPGLFLLGRGIAAVVNQDGTVNAPNQPAAAGSFISAYLTGLGAVSPAPADGAAAPATPLAIVTGSVSATVASVNAPILFAGLAPGFAGLYQVNLLVPNGVSGQVPLQFTMGGIASNSALMSVR